VPRTGLEQTTSYKPQKASVTFENRVFNEYSFSIVSGKLFEIPASPFHFAALRVSLVGFPRF
jgi:hypothetical protein